MEKNANMRRKLQEIYNHIFPDETRERKFFFAPGRVNLIGEHTDYNGGFVFPCTISLGTYAAVQKRNDQQIWLYSENFSQVGIIKVNLDRLEYNSEHNWANYPKGIISFFLKAGEMKSKILTGFNVVFFGNIPGGGLSSSASIEMLTCVILKELFHLQISMIDLLAFLKDYNIFVQQFLT